MTRKLIFAFALQLLLAAAAIAQTAQADKVDEFVQSELKRQRIPGVSIAVVRDGKVIKAKGYGQASVELNTPATPENVYQIGSVSKQFIATGIMLLVQDGKLRTEDKINQYLESPPDIWKDITIHHLLTHTGGLVRESPGFNYLKAQPDAEVIKAAYKTPLRFAPGTSWEYCNLGYFILGDIIRVVSGKPWSEFMTERVFKPAGMNATRTTTMSDIVPNRAQGYIRQREIVQNAEVILALRPSGAFLSTVLDLAKWDAALYSNDILKQPARELMWKPMVETTRQIQDKNSFYGYGWEVGHFKGHKIVTHGGTMAGYRSAFTRYIDDKLTIIVLTNLGNANPVTIERGIAAIYMPDMTTTATK